MVDVYGSGHWLNDNKATLKGMGVYAEIVPKDDGWFITESVILCGLGCTWRPSRNQKLQNDVNSVPTDFAAPR